MEVEEQNAVVFLSVSLPCFSVQIKQKNAIKQTNKQNVKSFQQQCEQNH